MHSNDVIIANSSIQCLGCEVNTLFDGEKSNDRLRMLNTTRRRLTKLIHQNCSVNLNNSWYIGCYGEKVLLRENITLFRLEWRKFGKKDNYAYFVKVRNLLNNLCTCIIKYAIVYPSIPKLCELCVRKRI